MTIQQVNALNLPEEVKKPLRAMIECSDHFKQRKQGKAFQAIILSWLTAGWPDPTLKREWIKLFGREKQPVAGNAKMMGGFKTKSTEGVNEFIGHDDCLGCSDEERKAKKAANQTEANATTQDVKANATPVDQADGGDAIADITAAKSVTDVLMFFKYDEQSPELVLAQMKSFAKTMGLEIHHAIKKPETVAEKIFDAMMDE